MITNLLELKKQIDELITEDYHDKDCGFLLHAFGGREYIRLDSIEKRYNGLIFNFSVPPEED